MTQQDLEESRLPATANKPETISLHFIAPLSRTCRPAAPMTSLYESLLQAAAAASVAERDHVLVSKMKNL
jgi:hypothetical protein